MKKIAFSTALFASLLYSAQFNVKLESSSAIDGTEAYLYTVNGSKDVLVSKSLKNTTSWMFKVPNAYSGMMRVYIPQGNNSINLISENKDVNINFAIQNEKVTDINYLDDSNKVMNNLQDIQRKKEIILPALYQMQEFYTKNSPFKFAIEQEIDRLSQKETYNSVQHPFISFYNSNYKKYLAPDATTAPVTEADMINFISNSGDMLESSSLLKPILISYLNSAPKAAVSESIDKMLKAVNLQSPRGQTVLSEFIEIFDAYEMTDLKNKYLAEATSLKCTINDRLAGTIAINKSVEIGAKFADYTFTNSINTKAKSIYDVKAAKKIILFWSSTCSHCEAELPKFIEKYNALKAQNIQIIALSLDNDKTSYDNRIKDLPWINDSELKGWNSSYAEKYNVRATPTYFVLDNENKIIAKPDHAVDVFNFLKLK